MTTATITTTIPLDVAGALEQWRRDPARHPRIGDWRQAGYRRGQWPPEGPTRIVRAGDLGILPGEDADLASRLQAALEDLEPAGGVLLLDAGCYVLDRPLLIHGSGVVLRGAGSSRTTLRFTRPLAESIGPARLGTSSAWSWNGGNVFIISRERYRRSVAGEWSGADPDGEGWLRGDVLTNVGSAERGTHRLAVADSTQVQVGEMVLLEVPDSTEHALLREMAGNVHGAATYEWERRAATIAGPTRYADHDAWIWPVRVVEVAEREVVLEQALKLSIGDGARLRALGPTVHDSGVEALTIENDLRVQTTHNINPGSNGVGLQAVHDCWVRDVHVVNADVAFALTSAKSCQLAGISASGRSLHHFVACRVQSHDNLIEDFRLDEFTVPAVAGSYLHGVNVEGFSCGNVYRRGVMHTGTFDSHRQLPFENLRTDITITNKDAVPGGALDAGPYFGARSVNWGIHVTNGNNLCIDISDFAPRSLTAGITGLSAPGSILPRGGMDFDGPLESESLAFGVDLDSARDLLEVQRELAPLDR